MTHNEEKNSFWGRLADWKHKLQDITWLKLDIFISNELRLPFRVIYDSLRIFLIKHCTIRATALAYTSLLAVVPLLILLTSISLYLGVADLFITHLPGILEKLMPRISNFLLLFFPGNTIDLNYLTDTILENIMPFLVKAQGIRLDSLGIIGGIGLLMVFILAVDNIETNMNTVWGVNDSRSYFQKVIIFIPFLILFAIGIGILYIFLSYMQEVLKSFLSFGKLGNILGDMSILAVLVSIVLVALWILYCYMPYVPDDSGFWKAFVKKTKKRWLAALISAVFTLVAVSIFIIAMGILQANMIARWSLFYGSLAVFPMIMLLLFGFWCIVLFGNALCYRISENERSKTYFLNRIKKMSAN
ncbi:MAG: YihY/virulence factor BrkB family protein [Fibromonadales bacterium]|nr:YihY/virulence factor BrkB family protein [Fibromonadales bacterium]